jgi:predicted nucleic acid-binding protein
LKRYILASSALISYFHGEESGRPVIDILKKTLEGKAESFMCVINWGELFYVINREHTPEKAQACLKLLSQYPVEIIDIDMSLTIEATKVKSNNKISYIDSFAVALAKFKKAELVTDNQDFKPLEREIKIIWI